MSGKFIFIAAKGVRYNRWVVLDDSSSIWLVQCDCGKRVDVRRDFVIRGLSKGCISCGQIKHGKESEKIYDVWAGMKQRCQNPNYHAYGRYGARGIAVCEAWQKFENFYADMGDKPRGKSLGRIDNNGNYEPSNCRWETPKQQIRNRSNTTYLVHNDETHSLGEWAEITGIAHGTLKRRYQSGLPIADILNPRLRRTLKKR